MALILKDDFKRCSCGKGLVTRREVMFLKEERGAVIENKNFFQYICVNCGKVVLESKKVN